MKRVKKIKSRYYKSTSAGKSECWYCNKATNWIFEDLRDKSEIFCCFQCLQGHTGNFRLKSKIINRLHIKKGKMSKLKAGITQ